MRLAADLHCHTVASTHAYSTILEMANSARAAGVQLLAITDHGTGCPDAPHIWHFHNLRKAVPRVIGGVRLLFGVEAEILDFDGRMGMDDQELGLLDWVVASMHTHIMRTGTKEDYTRAYLAIAENPLVHVIGHCATPFFEFDYERVLPVFRDKGKLVEVNESAIVHKKGVRDHYRLILEICKRERVPVVVNTDAHFCMAVGQAPEAEQLLKDLDFPMELIWNLEYEKIKGFLEDKKSGIF